MPAYNHRGRMVPGKIASELKEGDSILWGDPFPFKVVKVETSTSKKMLIITVEQNGSTSKKNIRAAAIVGLYVNSPPTVINRPGISIILKPR